MSLHQTFKFFLGVIVNPLEIVNHWIWKWIFKPSMFQKTPSYMIILAVETKDFALLCYSQSLFILVHHRLQIAKLLLPNYLFHIFYRWMQDVLLRFTRNCTNFHQLVFHFFLFLKHIVILNRVRLFKWHRRFWYWFKSSFKKIDTLQ